jgi:hypothetical protein
MYNKKEYQKKYQKKYYQEHKQSINCRHNRYRKIHPDIRKKDIQKANQINKSRICQNRQWLLDNNYYQCQRCGYREFSAGIDGHHVNPSDKKHKHDTLGNSWLKMPSEKFQKKIILCNIIFLCKNCHASLHHGDWNISELHLTKGE